MKVGKNVLWLVKSSGRILGPYSDRQVADLLRERMIVPLDEISRPADRWIFIRDEPVYAKVVEEIRVRNLRGHDDTTTRGSDNSNFTQTASMTPMQLDELTQEIASSNVPQTVQDILFQSIDDNVKPRGSARRSEEGDVYTHDGDLFVKKQASDTARWVWAVTAVVLIFTASFVVFRQYIAKPIQNKTMLNESTTAGVEALDEGDYPRALELFNRAYALDPNDTSIYLYLGILKIQVEEQPYQGRQLFEKLRTREDRDMKRVLTGIGLGYLKEGDLKNAEASFNKALDVDPMFVFAVINLGAVALQSEDYAKAVNHLQLAVKDGSRDGAEVLMLTEALTKLYEKEKEKRYLIDAAKFLKDHLADSRDYSQEVTLGLAYVESLLNSTPSKSATYEAVDKILDMDPYETNQHKHHIFIYRDKIKWNVLSQWCLRMTQDLDPNSQIIALEAYCLFRAGDWAEASRKIDDALAQTPKSPLVLSTYAYILGEMNSADRAQVMIEKGIGFDKDKKYLQSLRLKGFACQKSGDYECEKKVWPEVLAGDPRSLAGLAGMARVLAHDKSLKEAKKFLVQGLKISDRYKPFYPINKSVSQAEDLQKSRGL